MDRDKLKEKIREKIGIELCSTCSDSGLCLKDNNYCSCAEEAELALSVIEEAGIDLCQADASVKGETVSAPLEPLQAGIGVDAMGHLGEVLSFFANLDEGDRCRAFDEAIAFYNKHNPDAQIQGEPGFTWYICQRSPLGFNCRHPIEEPERSAGDTERPANAEGTLTHKSSPTEETDV